MVRRREKGEFRDVPGRPGAEVVSMHNTISRLYGQGSSTVGGDSGRRGGSRRSAYSVSERILETGVCQTPTLEAVEEATGKQRARGRVLL